MSIEGDLFRVTVKGSRESVIKMMNAVLKSFNSDKVIVESDDIDTMNSKLEMFTGQKGKDIGIPDLLGPVNDEDFYRFLELVRIEDDVPGLIAKFSYYLDESASYHDNDEAFVNSFKWDTVAIQYNCQVFLDDDWYSNGRFIRFGSATIYDALDGKIRKLHLESGSKYDTKEYPFFLKTLAHLYPDHYGMDWNHYHNDHPEVEITDDECLAWFNKQKQPWQQDDHEDDDEDDYIEEQIEETSLYPIDENGHAVIPEGTTRIEDYAFLQCNKLVSVSIPDTVVEIGEGAFGSCEDLTSITLPPSLKLIDEMAFCGCKKLTEIEIPLGIKIADNAFKDCPCEEVVMKKTK